MINNNWGLNGGVRPSFPNKTLALDWCECCYFDMNDAAVRMKKSIIWLVGPGRSAHPPPLGYSDGVGSWSLVRRYNLASPQKSIKSIVIVTKLSFGNDQNKTDIFHYIQNTDKSISIFFWKQLFQQLLNLYLPLKQLLFLTRPCFQIMSWDGSVCQTPDVFIEYHVQLVAW